MIKDTNNHDDSFEEYIPKGLETLNQFVEHLIVNSIDTINDFAKSMIPIISGFLLHILLFLNS